VPNNRQAIWNGLNPWEDNLEEQNVNIQDLFAQQPQLRRAPLYMNEEFINSLQNNTCYTGDDMLNFQIYMFKYQDIIYFFNLNNNQVENVTIFHNIAQIPIHYIQYHTIRLVNDEAPRNAILNYINHNNNLIQQGGMIKKFLKDKKIKKLKN
jgi:hypothetical protein